MRRGMLCVLALAVASGSLAGCSGSEETKNDIQVAVASYDLAVGPSSRFTLGLQVQGENGLSELVAYGTAKLRFTYLGTKDNPTPSTVFGQAQTGTFLPLPGSNAASPPPEDARIAPSTEVRGVYATQAGFDRPGAWGVEVDVEIDDTTHRGRAAFDVAERRSAPGPGDPAPVTDTLTMASTDVAREAIDSRAGTGGEVPDPELHRTSLAASLAAGRPALVSFSTPVFCQSQFCGPVTDMIQELSNAYANRADFIHVEVFKDGQKRVLNDALKQWGLETEPWVYLIGADGKIVLRLDNVATRGELEPHLQRLPVIGPSG